MLKNQSQRSLERKRGEIPEEKEQPPLVLSMA